MTEQPPGRRRRAPRPAARPHRPREAREVARGFVQGAHRATASWSGCWPTRPPTSGSTRRSTSLEIAARRDRRGRRLRAGAGHRRRRHDPARRRDHPRARHARCWASTSGTSASWPRPSTTTSSRPIDAIVERRYTAEERLTIDVTVHRDGELVASTFALNEASVEKAARAADARGRRRDRRPAAVAVGLRRRGLRDADRLDGLQLQRRRAGRLAGRRGAADGADQRARPVRPAAGGRARLGARRRGARPHRGRRACCGATAAARSTCRPARGSRYAAGPAPVRLVRLHEAPFTDRLVAKFGLPVEGWRGAAERRRRRGRRCLRRSGSARSGVIESSTLELGPGLTVITGETGAGKTMIVTALGLLLGGRADSGAVRTGAETARVEGVVRVDDLAGFAGAVEEAGGEVEDDRVVLARNVSAEGRSRAFVGRRLGAGARCWPSSPSRWWPCTASPTSTGCSRPRAQREALDRFGGGTGWPPLAALRRRCTPACSSRRARARRGRREPPASGPGRPTCCGSGSARSRPSTRAGRGRRRWRPRRPGSGFADTLRTAAEQAREALSSEPGQPRRAGGRRGGAHRRSTASASTTPRPASWPTGWPSSPTCSPTWPPTSRRTPPGSRPTRPGWPASPSAGRR